VCTVARVRVEERTEFDIDVGVDARLVGDFLHAHRGLGLRLAHGDVVQPVELDAQAVVELDLGVLGHVEGDDQVAIPVALGLVVVPLTAVEHRVGRVVLEHDPLRVGLHQVARHLVGADQLRQRAHHLARAVLVERLDELQLGAVGL